ncbi:DNA mismatch repair protein MutS [Christensenella timonensis]|uniref:DNA mismatch repair protein MutS n=1 Tax=Christensenella timonensis TaxID=1816678 RepID=UPI00082ECBDA|nr:DNA mismatch repair protein MutS [Christensenella timonensis]
MAQLTPMMQQYLDLKEEYKDCILMFRLGDFYEMFFDDAVLVSKELELTLTGRDCGLEERAPMCGVPHHAVDTYIARLVSNGHKVAICDQLEDPRAAKGIVKRGITRVVTPGTVVETSMLQEKENSYILSVFFGEHAIGIGYCDVSTGEFCIAQPEDETALLNEMTRLNPQEVIVSDSHAGKLLKLTEKSRFKNAFINPYFDWAYEAPTAQKTLQAHFKVKSLSGFGCEGMDDAVCSAGALMQYLKDTQKNTLLHITHIKALKETAYMVLDPNTRRNLELTQTLMEGSKKGSLLWLLDQTKTAMGGRLLKKFILQPLKKIDEIDARLDAVAEIKQNLYLRNSLSDYLSGIYDLERIITRISYGTIDAKDCLSLKSSIAALPYLKGILEEAASPLLTDIYENLDDLADLHQLLEQAINEDAPNGIMDGNIIKRGYHAEIDALIDASVNGKNWLVELEAKEREETGIKTLKVRYNRVFGYYIEVTKSYLPQVPYRYLRKQTLANCERYITEELKEMEDTILGAEEKRNALEYQVFLEIRDKLAQNVSRMQGCAQRIALLDVLQSMAAVAYDNNYVRPRMSNDGTLNIKNGRHPVVESILQQGFVPNDAQLDHGQQNMLLITGPNMAGKSTYMRQVGLIVLMAHMGSFVPADEAQICLVDRVFTRVGASDDLASGQSTFMVEMNELANILNNATQNSLLILDEIGRGTSTTDGLSIAWASVEYILQKLHAKTLFATHYHELVELENMFSGIKNYSVAVKELGNDIVFLHKIIEGGTDRSFGIEVAKLAGLPQQVITRANVFLNQLQNYEMSITGDSPADTGKAAPQEATMPKAVSRLKGMNVDTLTPIEALNLVYTIKKELDNE